MLGGRAPSRHAVCAVLPQWSRASEASRGGARPIVPGILLLGRQRLVELDRADRVAPADLELGDLLTERDRLGGQRVLARGDRRQARREGLAQGLGGLVLLDGLEVR